MTKKKAEEIMQLFDQLYPDAGPELDFVNPYELLVAVILSAQCTDVRVNQVTKVLFDEAPDAYALENMTIDRLEAIIKPCGLYKSKAKNLSGTAHLLVEQYDGEVPSDHDALKALPGVGQKTANVVVSNAFGQPAIAVDTHVFRVSNRIGLVKAKTVEETEKQLRKLLPKDRWSRAHHQLIFHGRRVCKARKPNCGECLIAPHCAYYKTISGESNHA